MKVCSKCREEKELTEFSKNKYNKDGYQYNCKTCRKKYREGNTEYMKKYRKEYREKNKEAIAEKAKIYYEENKEDRNAYNKMYYSANKELLAEKHRKYREENKDKYKKISREYMRKRRSEDSTFKLKCNISRSIHRIISEQGYDKKSRTHEILGCSYKDFLGHLNNNPYGFMYGDSNIDIDHIIPVSSANTEEEVIKLNHYTNFQLLPTEYNRYIKIDNEWDEDHFRVWLSKKTKNIKNCYIK